MNTVPFNEQDYEKEPGTSDQSLFRSQNKLRKIPLFVMIHHLTKFNDVIYTAVFQLFQKITSANLEKPIHDSIDYSTFICPFESGKGGKEGEKLQKFDYLQNEKSIFNDKL